MFAVITCFYHRQKCVCAHAAQALPFPFGRKRKQKGPKRPSRWSLVHGTSAATRLSHERTRSAKLPKLNASRRFKHMGSFVFALSPCKAAHVERSKIPSRATQKAQRPQNLIAWLVRGFFVAAHSRSMRSNKKRAFPCV